MSVDTPLMSQYKEIKKENAPLPFNLLELQKYSNKKWGYTGEQVMEITQSLRDKYKAIKKPLTC